jgi:hypothetical protein
MFEVTGQFLEIEITAKTVFTQVEIDNFFHQQGILAVIENGKTYLIKDEDARTKACNGHGCVAESFAPYFEFGGDMVEKDPTRFVSFETVLGKRYADIINKRYFKIGKKCKVELLMPMQNR